MSNFKYVADYKATLNDLHDDKLCTLIWGDPVHVLEEQGAQAHVYARGHEGWIEAGALGDQNLLEIYVIDVGQGDAVLVKTPDNKWHLVDAGIANREQMTKKGAANFIRWKFYEDLRRTKVSLANVIVTHPDYDHYGGLLDLFNGRLANGKTFDIEVENFYHNGLARFSTPPRLGQTQAGGVDEFPLGSHDLDRQGTFITELLDDQPSFANPPRALSGTFAKYAELVSRVPRHVQRLSHLDRFLPGYSPAPDSASIRVLGPILECFDGMVGLRVLGNDGQTVNGHSIALRIDYGSARILLTGDLNTVAQKLLLHYQPTAEFEVDVAKGCHHGSEDVDLDFVKIVKARATVISSGDHEEYTHPRPAILGAMARHGRESRSPNGKVLPPLIYSTELARSVKLDYAEAVRIKQTDRTTGRAKPIDAGNVEVHAKDWTEYRPLSMVWLAADLVYGLVNIRTDGKNVLCATMNEKENDFDVKVFLAGVNV